MNALHLGAGTAALLLWDTESLQLVARLSGHRDYIYDLDWSPDGTTLVTASGDGTVRVWRTEPLADRMRLASERKEALQALTPRLQPEQEESASATLARVLPTLSEKEMGLARRLLMERAGR